MTELLTDQLRLMARRHPDEIGYRNLDADTALTFARWDGDSNRLARGLVADGIAKGDRVAIYVTADDAIPWVSAYAAVHKAGAYFYLSLGYATQPNGNTRKQANLRFRRLPVWQRYERELAKAGAERVRQILRNE